MRIAGIEEESFVDGPGIRFTIFFQGCKHNCLGCHNPLTHPFDEGSEKYLDEILLSIKEHSAINGFTITGGDPLFQIDDLIKLCRLLKENFPKKTIIVYTGYCYEDILKLGDKYITMLSLIDYLIDGKFVLALRDLTLLYRGSSNQRLIDVATSLSTNTTTLWDGK